MKNKTLIIEGLYQRSLFKLNIFETQTTKTFELQSELIRLMAELWTIARIVFEYHSKRKKILIISPIDLNVSPPTLFYSVPVHDFFLQSFNRFKNLLKSTKHILIPQEAWVNGLLTNPYSCIRLLKRQKGVSKKVIKICNQIKNNVSLVIIIESSHTGRIVSECFSKGIPVIVFKDVNLDLKLKSCYEIDVDYFRFTKIRYIDLLFRILSSIIKKKKYLIGTIRWAKLRKKRYKEKQAKKKFYEQWKLVWIAQANAWKYNKSQTWKPYSKN